MNNPKVKACPFCGKQPAVFPSGDGTGEMVECQTPGCVNPHVSYYGKNVAQAIRPVVIRHKHREEIIYGK